MPISFSRGPVNMFHFVGGKIHFADEEMILHCLGGPNVITRVPVRGRKEGQSRRRRYDDRSRQEKEEAWSRKQRLDRYALKTQEGVARQGMHVTSQSWKGTAWVAP